MTSKREEAWQREGQRLAVMAYIGYYSEPGHSFGGFGNSLTKQFESFFYLHHMLFPDLPEDFAHQHFTEKLMKQLSFTEHKYSLITNTFKPIKSAIYERMTERKIKAVVHELSSILEPIALFKYLFSEIKHTPVTGGDPTWLDTYEHYYDRYNF